MRTADRKRDVAQVSWVNGGHTQIRLQLSPVQSQRLTNATITVQHMIDGMQM